MASLYLFIVFKGKFFIWYPQKSFYFVFMTPKHRVTFNFFSPSHWKLEAFVSPFSDAFGKGSTQATFSFLCTRSFSSFRDNVSPRH